MKIGIDARFYGEAGPGRYVKALIQHLEKIDQQNIYLVFLRQRGWDLYNPSNPNFKKVLADYPWYSFQEQFAFLFTLLREKLDILYVPHFNIPVLYPRKLVTAIPDLIMHSYSTEKGSTLPVFYFKFKKIIYRLVFWWAVVRSEKVIVPSKVVIDEFIKSYPKVSKDKFVLAYEGVDPDFLNFQPQGAHENKKYILYVGSAYEHKNLYRLVEAFKILKDRFYYPGKLVIAGKRDKFSESLHTYVDNLGLNEQVIFPGLQKYVTDEEIFHLRKQAEVYVFPSLKEGFSLTPMEAQAAGLPAVISNIPIHKEIYEDSVEYFDPLNIEEMAQKINDVINNQNKKEELMKKGLEHFKKFNWSNTAQITLEIFNQV